MLDCIKASGSFYDVGVIVGERTREGILSAARYALPMLLEKGFGGDDVAMRAATDGYVEASGNFFPQSIEFMHGLADGCGMVRHEQLAVAFGEELEYFPRVERCSTMVIWTPDGPVIARNEDFWESYFEGLAIYDLTFDNFPRVVSLNYVGYMPHLGGSLTVMEDQPQRSFALANDSLWLPTRHGIPKQVKHFRAALARGVGDAISFLVAQPSSLSDHFTVASVERAVSLEVSNAENAVEVARWYDIVPRDVGNVLTVTAPFCHTNSVRWLEPKMPDPAPPGSHMRYWRLESVAQNDPPRTYEELEKLFSTRDGIIRRDNEVNLTLQPNSCTLATTIIDPGKRRMTILRYRRDGSQVRDVFQL
ncbi:MAG: C45 family peptidase [Patescibacteria group bacterium]|jgi:hypothetical protein